MYKIWDFFIPAIFTLLAIRYLPKLSAWAHGIEVKNFFERRLVYDSQRAEFEEKRTGFLNRVAKQKEAQRIQEDSIENQTSEKEKWQDEFAQLSENKEFAKAMSKAIDSIYYSSGNFNQGAFGKELLDLLLARNVVEVVPDPKRGLSRLAFTSKGDDFAKMFTSKSRWV